VLTRFAKFILVLALAWTSMLAENLCRDSLAQAQRRRTPPDTYPA